MTQNKEHAFLEREALVTRDPLMEEIDALSKDLTRLNTELDGQIDEAPGLKPFVSN